MRDTNALESIAAALFYAAARDLDPIEYNYKTPEEHRAGTPGVQKSRRPSHYECSVVSFPQLWSSTALGFGGIGGRAMTAAQTTIIESEHNRDVCVYFGTRFAYHIKRPNQLFSQDVSAQRVAPVSKHSRYESTPE